MFYALAVGACLMFGSSVIVAWLLIRANSSKNMNQQSYIVQLAQCHAIPNTFHLAGCYSLVNQSGAYYQVYCTATCLFSSMVLNLLKVTMQHLAVKYFVDSCILLHYRLYPSNPNWSKRYQAFTFVALIQFMVWAACVLFTVGVFFCHPSTVLSKTTAKNKIQNKIPKPAFTLPQSRDFPTVLISAAKCPQFYGQHYLTQDILDLPQPVTGQWINKQLISLFLCFLLLSAYFLSEHELIG